MWFLVSLGSWSRSMWKSRDNSICINNAFHDTCFILCLSLDLAIYGGHIFPRLTIPSELMCQHTEHQDDVQMEGTSSPKDAHRCREVWCCGWVSLTRTEDAFLSWTLWVPSLSSVPPQSWGSARKGSLATPTTGSVRKGWAQALHPHENREDGYECSRRVSYGHDSRAEVLVVTYP